MASSLTIDHALFEGYDHLLPTNERIALVYKRAVHICRIFGLTHEDCVNLTPKFWEFYQHPIMTRDYTLSCMMAIHYNLCLTAIGLYAKTRPDLHDIIKKLETWEYNGTFLLTELGHGLDAANLQTTAQFTTFENGKKGFILHSPNEDSQKWTAHTTPLGKMPKVAIVYARLMVHGKFKGIRVFVVPLTNGIEMCKGITSKFVGPRGGITPFDHSLTKFNNVELPLNSLLCDDVDIEKEINSNSNSKSFGEIFAESLNIVDTSKVAVSFVNCGALKLSSTICGMYFKRRTIIGKGAKKIPILAFRTQQIPLAYAVCKAIVFEEFLKKSAKQMTDSSIPLLVRKAIAAVAKQIVCQETISSLRSLLEKSGAQGVFEHNRFIDGMMSAFSIQIAEGEVGVVGIKVASEILLTKYSLPEPKEPSHLLSLHEVELFNETRSLASSFSAHRSQDFEKYILPLCDGLMRAAGFRMAYEAAKYSGVNQKILDLFCSIAHEDDPAWYVTHMKISRSELRKIRDNSVDAVMPDLETYLSKFGMSNFVSSPIVSESSMLQFHNSVPSFVGTSLEINLFPTSKL